VETGFPKKIMLKQQAKAKCRFNLKLFRFCACPRQRHCGAERSGLGAARQTGMTHAPGFAGAQGRLQVRHG
jgi:hypothetical protein